MSSNKQINILIRNINKVKKLNAEISIDSSYYSDIRLFIFGNSNTDILTEDNLPSTGIHNKVENNKLQPSNSPDITVNINDSQKELMIADITDKSFIQQLTKNKVKEKDYLFPSDLVSILTDLAKLFYSYKNLNLNKKGLRQFARDNNLELVKQWGEAKVKGHDTETLIQETNFFKEPAELHKLLQEVVKACLLYEKSKEKINDSNFIIFSDLNKQVNQKLKESILANFTEYQEKIVNKLDEVKKEDREKFIKAKEKIEEEIEKKVKDLNLVKDKLLSSDNTTEFEKLKYIANNKYKFSDNPQDDEDKGIESTQLYLNFLDEQTKNFLEKNKQKLIDNYINPLFQETSSVAKEVIEEPEEEDTGTDEEEETKKVNLKQFQQEVVKKLVKEISLFIIDQNKDLQTTNDEVITDIVTKYLEENKYLSLNNLTEEFNEDLLNPQTETFDADIYNSPTYLNFINDIFIEFLDKYSLDEVINSSRQEESTTTTAKVTATKSTEVNKDKKGISDINLQRLQQKELQKLKLMAEGQLFGAYGINLEELNLKNNNLQQNLQKKIEKVFNSLSESDRQKLFLTSSLGRSNVVGVGAIRSKLIAKAFISLGKDSSNKQLFTELYQALKNNEQFNSLDKTKLQDFLDLQKTYFVDDVDSIFNNNLSANKKNESWLPTTQEALQESVKEILNTDNPTVALNIEHSLDALLIQNQDLQKTIEELNKLSSQELAQKLGDPNIVSLDQERLEQLRLTLISYSKTRATNFNFSNKNEVKRVVRQVNFVTLREAVSHHGAEETNNALTVGRVDKQEEISKVAKQYKTFFTLWNNLTPAEQRLVYAQFNVAYNKNLDSDRQLGFIPEFIFFDITKLEEYKGNNQQIKSAYEESKKLQDKYLNALKEEVLREQQYEDLLKQSYLAYTEKQQRLLIADYLAQTTNKVLTSYPDQNFFTQFSPVEIAIADEYIKNNNYQISDENQHYLQQIKQKSLFTRLKESKLGNKLGFNKQLSVKEKLNKSLKQSLKKKTKKVVDSVINSLPPSWQTTVLKIANKIGYKGVGIIIATIIGGLVYGVYKLLNFLTGGLLDSLLKLKSSLNNKYATTETINNRSYHLDNLRRNSIRSYHPNTATNTALTTTATFGASIINASGVFFGIPVSLLAPAGAMLIAMTSTLYIIFTIQSAFLIPTPKDIQFHSVTNGDPILGDLGCFVLGDAGIHLQNNMGIDLITTEWTEKDIEMLKESFSSVAGNSQYISRLCGGGEITLYKGIGDMYGGFAYSHSEIIIHGILSTSILEYTLIHETGHLIDYRNPGLRTAYAKIKTSPFCYTYPLINRCGVDDEGKPHYMETEAFAEGIVIYVLSNRFAGVNKKFPDNYPFKEKYPDDYSWFQDNIFGGVEFH